MAMASARPSAPAPAPFSGGSAFVPAKKAPVALTASAPQAAPVTKAQQVAPGGHVADPKLDTKAGIGVRIGTTGTGDGN
jgi:hypothetical protein